MTIGQALSTKVAYASMVNAAGTIVAPTSDAVNFALVELASFYDTTTIVGGIDLTNPGSKPAWPISMMSYLAISNSETRSTCAVRSQAALFLTWLYSNTQVNSIASNLNAALMPAIVLTQFNVLKVLGALTCFGEPLSTASTTISVTTAGETNLNSFPSLTTGYYSQIDTASTFSYLAVNGLTAFQRLQSGEIDLAWVTPASMSQATLATMTNNGKYLFIPSYAFTISPLVILNPNNRTGNANIINVLLTPDIIAKIYLGNITQW